MICKSEITAFRLWPSNPNNPEDQILVELFRLGFLSRAIHRSCDCRGAKEEGSGYFANRYPLPKVPIFLQLLADLPCIYPKETSMLARNILSVLPATAFFLAYSAAAQTSPTDLFTKVAEQSRHLADTGQWDEAKAVLEEQLSKKDAVEVARFKAELAHLAADRNAYFHKDEAPVLAALQEARSAVQADQDKPALAILEMAEGRFTYWKALDQTKDWGPPTEDFDRALQTYKELRDEVGLGEAMFYRGVGLPDARAESTCTSDLRASASAGATGKQSPGTLLRSVDAREMVPG